MLEAYINSDNSIDFNSTITPIKSIPVGVYIPQYSDMRGIYLSRTNDFTYLNEYYLLDKFEEYVLESFKASTKSVGALYLGVKGSGKTKRAHKLALDTGLPVIYIQNLNIINRATWKDVISSEVFNNVVFFIDEYEKKLEDDTSVALLEWLDGSINNKQLFILIGNEQASNKFSSPLLDRLSRILWKKTFPSLTEEEVRYLVNKLSIKEDKKELIDLITNIPVISLDNSLQIIKTTNLFPNVSSEEIINMLNINFKLFENFILCDDQNERVDEYDSTIKLSLSKNKVAFDRPDFYISFSNKFINKLASINKDINKNESVCVNCSFEDLNIKFFNKNKISITVNYIYDSESDRTKERIKSSEPITLYLLKESYFYSLSSSKHSLVF